MRQSCCPKLSSAARGPLEPLRPLAYPHRMELDHIHIKGAREHNLDDIEVKIPKKKLVVLCGV